MIWDSIFFMTLIDLTVIAAFTFLYNQNGERLYLSRAVKQHLGIDPQELEGRGAWYPLHPESKKNITLLPGRVNRLEMLLVEILQYSCAGRIIKKTSKIILKGLSLVIAKTV